MLTGGVSSIPSLSPGACHCLGSAAEMGGALLPQSTPLLETCLVNAGSGWPSDRVLSGGLRCPGRCWQGWRWRGWWSPLHGRLLLFVSETPCRKHPKIATWTCNTPSGTSLPGSRPFLLSHLLPRNPWSFFSSGTRGEAGLHRRCPLSKQ